MHYLILHLVDLHHPALFLIQAGISESCAAVVAIDAGTKSILIRKILKNTVKLFFNVTHYLAQQSFMFDYCTNHSGNLWENFPQLKRFLRYLSIKENFTCFQSLFY